MAEIDESEVRALAISGDAEAQLVVALLVAWGYGADGDDPSNVWLKKAADNGVRLAQYAYAEKLWDESGADFAKPLEYCRLAAEQDLAIAQDRLGLVYEHGIGVEPNLKVAAEWYLRATKNGNLNATESLGYLYQEGLGVVQDITMAITHYKCATSMGSASAAYSIAELYKNGKSLDKSESDAVSWYQKSANLGSSSAHGILALVFEKGLYGQESNSSKAMHHIGEMEKCRRLEKQIRSKAREKLLRLEKENK